MYVVVTDAGAALVSAMHFLWQYSQSAYFLDSRSYQTVLDHSLPLP